MTYKYPMRISRLTVDKLGVKLYDKVSAVIAELVSNSYDADATEVVIEAPMGEYLASKAGGVVTDRGREIRVTDNGIGMTPDQVVEYYLVVGAERRTDNRPGRGDTSPKFSRRVLGRKGVGKLAPFGICEIIEVITSGGEWVTRTQPNGKSESGYLTAHFILKRNDILENTESEYPAEIGRLDETLARSTGTTVILRQFSYRLVPDHRTLARQLSHRFGLPSEDWRILTRDTLKTSADEGYESIIGPFSLNLMENTKTEFRGPEGQNFSTDDPSPFTAVDPSGATIDEFKAGFSLDGRFYPVTGWAAYSRESYRDDLMAGIRIYCRGKIAAQTALFNRGAGFHGEHDIRSYLIGELHADWLDEDEDLIQTDRRDVLWSHELGHELQQWGQQVIRKIGNLSRDPLRKKTWERFLEIGMVDEKVKKEFPGEGNREIREKAIELAKLLGQTIRAGEVEDSEVVEPMVQLTLTFAPHITLNDKLRQAASDANTTFAALSEILKVARIAELASFGRIADDRIKVIQQVQNLKNHPDTAEQDLQDLIVDAPWLIDPQWAPITANQSFSTLKREFVEFYKNETGEDLQVESFSHSLKRPDFVLSSQDNGLQIVEIKAPGHELKNDEMERIITYHDVMYDFLNKPGNAHFRDIFRSFHITLVCDGLNLSGAQNISFRTFRDDNILTHITWTTFLARTELMHRDFLKEAERQKQFI